MLLIERPRKPVGPGGPRPGWIRMVFFSKKLMFFGLKGTFWSRFPLKKRRPSRDNMEGRRIRN
jgi:hypothetical protein